MSNNNPSIDPSLQNTLAGSVQFAFNKLMQNVDSMLPAKVIAFDRNANRVQVQPLIAMVTTDGSTISRAQFASIPVLMLGGGNFMLNFNLNPGDLGWIIANDRDISGFLQTYSESTPNTVRVHNFADSIFIPDIMKGFTINSEDADNAVLQSVDGTVRISLGTAKIKITAPTIELNGNVIVDGTLTVQDELILENGITSSGGGTNNALFVGNMHVSGDITASGAITPDVPP